MENKLSADRDHVYRVDKFSVPEHARAEFLERVRLTHDVLRVQPGFLRQFLLEQTAGPGKFNFVTFVEWESQNAVEQARDAVAAHHRQLGFDPQQMRSRLGIDADVASYRRIDA